ncbi:unnamed protein product [Peronospora destructor]|uniref:Ribosomal protein L1 n=1 Tax=Peronospora destructor TaxID=86335 RepID=A0AAV0SXH2_9STRA|nr:unnamed protein product [Peronospora destructor]
MVEVMIRKGLRNPLDEAQVRRAVLALHTFAAKKNEERTKTPLVEDIEYLSCILTRKLVPAKTSLKPIPITLPHALYDESAEICLFVKDDDKKRIKETLEKDPVQGVTKVMTVKKLRKNFSRFEDKRALATTYDMFLADDRVLPYLKGPLGTTFLPRRRPLAGVCNNVKVARLDMTPEQIVDNIMVAANSCASLIPKGWNGVQSISIKTNNSVALPVYNALAPLAKLPPVGKTANLKKRKLDEYVAEAEEAEKETQCKKPVVEEKEVPKTKKNTKAVKVTETTEKMSKKQKRKPAKTTTPSAKKNALVKKKVAKK